MVFSESLFESLAVVSHKQSPKIAVETHRLFHVSDCLSRFLHLVLDLLEPGIRLGFDEAAQRAGRKVGDPIVLVVAVQVVRGRVENFRVDGRFFAGLVLAIVTELLSQEALALLCVLFDPFLSLVLCGQFILLDFFHYVLTCLLVFG